MSSHKIGGIITYALREQARAERERERNKVRQFARQHPGYDYSDQVAKETREALWRREGPVEEVDWEYNAASYFFNLPGAPPKMTFMDMFKWDQKVKEIEQFEQRRDEFEKYTGKRYVGRRGGWGRRV